MAFKKNENINLIKRITFRITRQDYEMIKNHSNAKKIKMAQYIRKASLDSLKTA